MMQALSNHFSTRFMFFVLFVWGGFGALTPGHAVLIGPNPPSLSATKFGTTVDLRWTMDCTITSVNIQESTNGTAWNTVYTGLGNPNDGTMMSFATIFGPSGPSVCAGDWTSSRFVQLTNKTQSGYYYRINACKSPDCGEYGNPVPVGSINQTPAAPATISSPASNSTGSFSVSWAASSGAQRYELQQRINAGAWVAKYSGTATSYAVSGLTSGSYQFQIRACASTCSAWKLSSNTQVTLAQSGTDWKNFTPVTVPNASGSDSAPSESVDLSAASLKGQASVSGGQASYQIPIDLPPGRNGLQPSVSLSYNSQGGNGLLGVGWSLNAGSAISRCPSTIAQDKPHLPRAVTFSSLDRLCLNGQRLVAVPNSNGITGAYGVDRTEYRTEMDSFVKVVQFGDMNSAASYFTVRQPNGRLATYGKTADSKHVLSSASLPLSWQVNEELDPSGNAIIYAYDTSVVGENLIDKITYSDDRYLQFVYEARTDVAKSYVGKGHILSTRRLKKILVGHNTAGTIIQYVLTFKSSGISGRSLLSDVTQCDADGLDCIPATKFNWADTALTYVSESTPINATVAIEKYTPSGDFDGNGSFDFPGNTKDGRPGYYVDAEENYVPNGHDNSNCFNNNFSSSMVCHNADINQDGKTDFVNIEPVTNKLRYGVILADNSKIKWTYTGVTFNDGVDSLLAIADFNGDSYPDLLAYDKEYENSTVYFYPHTGDPLFPYQQSTRQKLFDYKNTHGEPRSNIIVVGDLDGDGYPDLIQSSEQHLTSIWLIKPNNVGGVILHNKYLGFKVSSFGDDEIFQRFADVDGDGLVDWLGMLSTSPKLYFARNIGGTFATPIDTGIILPTRTFTIQESFGLDGTREFIKTKKVINKSAGFRVMDIDFDGKAELLFPSVMVAEACSKVTLYNHNYQEFCGNEIYTETYAKFSLSMIASIEDKYDYSVYRFGAIKFDSKTGAGTPVATSIYGSINHSVVADPYGTGLDSLLFSYGCGTSACRMKSSSVAGFTFGKLNISRNYGAGNGSSTSAYAAVDYLKSVTDGLGNRSQWRYRPLSTSEASAGQSKLYTTDHDEVGSGYVHFASSMYVVQSFKQSNGQGGQNETQYAYKGAMYNLHGRGFSGFNQIWEKDMQRDKTVHSTFKQKFPEVGLLTSQKVSVAGVTVQQTTNTWADNPQHSVTKVYHNILTKSVQQSKDLTGTALSTQESFVATSDVDQWGNVKKSSQKTTDYIKGQANTYESVTETSFIPDVSAWWLTKFEWTQTSNKLAVRGWGDDPAGSSDKVQSQLTTVNSWNTTHKKPAKVTYSASGSSCTRIEETSFNGYGLPSSITVKGQSSSCTVLTARTTSFSYTKNGTTASADGYLPYTVTNAKGHVTKTEYDMGLGVPIKVTAPNSIVTQTLYDAIGRPVQVKQTGSPTQYLRYLLADNGANLPYDNSNSAVVMTRTSGAGQPETEQYFDSQGRLLRIATQGFNGGYQYQDKHYDALGHLLRESIPYGNGTGAEYTEFSDFDALDRPARRSIPNGKSGLESTYTYDGLTTNITVGGRTMSRTYGSQGWLYETVDALAGSNRFAYDGAGRPLVIQDANAKKIVASYNGFGHKTKVVDPNQGATVFGYNSLGELDKQTDANGVVQTYVLDTLGRITSKVTTGGNAPGTATYVWDTLKQGLLSSETENGISRAYAYTAALQLASTTVTVDGVGRTIKHQYDSFYGRPKALEYPNGLTLKYGYNDYGYLEQTGNAASGYVYRNISEMDEAGHITGAKLANNLMTESRAYNGEGTMGSVEVTGPLGLLHAHYYDGYDDFMNLINERNGATGLTKGYSYDSLNRLSQYRFSGTSPYVNATVDYTYDKVGNFLKKTDYSANIANAYRYGGSASCAAGNNAGPNAVCQLTKLNNTLVNFQYDNRGNLRVGDGLTMTYNAMDKPLTITGRGPGNSTVSGFVYGSDGMRAKQSRSVSGLNTSTYYVDKYYEVDSDGSWRAYLDDIAVLSYSPARQHLLHFTLRDRLGSGTTMVDQNGVVISRRYFDPFGKTTTQSPSASLLENIRRMTYDLDIAKMQDLDITNKNRRGFTDHEHLNEQQLIHMNGRVYDYNLGRFMSVDPLIQSPTSTQSVNPYSYIMNNPLAGTDPTGYCSTGTAIKHKEPAGCSVIYEAGTGDLSKKSADTKITHNGGNNYTTSIQLDKKTTLEVYFKVNDIGSLGAKNAMWTDQYGDPSSIPAGFNGTETAYNDAGGDSRLTPFGVSVAQDQAIRSDAAGQAGFAGAVLLTGGALSAYIGAEAVGLVFIAGSGGDITDVALARLPIAKGGGNLPLVNPTHAELISINAGTKLQSHHLLPKYLGKMLGYTEKQMLDHPATLITQFSHTGKMNPNAMHKAISNYLPPMIRGNQAVYSNSQIRIGLQNAYNDIGRPELFNSISPLIK
jgi:RHS repeat-associated protein